MQCVPVSDLSNGSFEKSDSKVSKSKKKLVRGRPRKALVAMYHSQISGDKNTIKIRIKKSHLTAQVQLQPCKKKSGRRKKHKVHSDTDASDTETMRKRLKVVTDNNKNEEEAEEPQEQSVWGEKIPDVILYKIFEIAVMQDGCLPTLVR